MRLTTYMGLKTKIKLDECWRQMEGKVVATQSPPKVKVDLQDEGDLERKVIQEAKAQSVADLESETQAMRDMTIRAFGQATGPTAAPVGAEAPPIAAATRRSSRRPPSSSSRSSSSTSSKSTSARPRRRRGRSARRRSPPPGVFAETFEPR